MADEPQFAWTVLQGIAVVSPRGELDLSSADRLRRCLQEAIESTGPRVVVDLASTGFLDSSTLGVLVGVAKQVHAAGGWLRLASVDNSVVLKVLQITQLDDYLGHYPDVARAIDGSSMPEPGTLTT